jgi:hypothetical protein
MTLQPMARRGARAAANLARLHEHRPERPLRPAQGC